MHRWIRSLFTRAARATHRVAVVLAVLLVAGTWKGEFCFAAGTPLLTPNGGAKPIEEFVAGELILSRDEWDVEGPVEPKVVEEVFVRFGGVLCLSAGGQTIKTTHAHPFWVVGKGWIPAKEIQVGDWLLGHDGQKTQVDAITEGEWETVYNLRVADHHTYFVGCSEWGFSLWAHNDYATVIATLIERGFYNRSDPQLRPNGQIGAEIRDLVDRGYSDREIMDLFELAWARKGRSLVRDLVSGELVSVRPDPIPKQVGEGSRRTLPSFKDAPCSLRNRR